MSEIKLVSPSEELEHEALAYRQEHFDCGEAVINGSALFDKTESYTDWLIHVRTNSNEATVQPEWVVFSTFFAVRESDSRIVGMIDIRHYLNDFLKEYGGHVGYAVRPSERRKGYATEMLKLAIEYCRSLGIDRVMLGCYKDNLPSIKTIEKNGGALEKEILYLDGKPMLVYWIELHNGERQ